MWQNFLNGNLILFSIIFWLIFKIYNINFDDLWYDEILSFWVCKSRTFYFRKLKIHNRTEPNTFSFHFLLKIFYSIFGYSPDNARYLSTFFGILSILLSIKMAKLLNINKIKNFLVLLFAFNIFLISYSQDGFYIQFYFFFFFCHLFILLKYLKSMQKKEIFSIFYFHFNSDLFASFCINNSIFLFYFSNHKIF